MIIEHHGFYINATLTKIVGPDYERGLYMTFPNGKTIILINFDKEELQIGKEYQIVLYEYCSIVKLDRTERSLGYWYYDPVKKCGIHVKQDDEFYFERRNELLLHISSVSGRVERHSSGTIWIDSEYPVILDGGSISQSFANQQIMVGDYIIASISEMRCTIIKPDGVVNLQ